jgi:uncharacterized protein (TIGR02118 family)
MYRVLFAMHRKDGMSAEDFVAHYRDSHIPITRRFAGLRQYDVFPVIGDEGPDAFAIMVFDSAEDFEAAAASDDMKEAMADSAKFVRAAELYTIDHIPVVGGVEA